MNEQYWSWLLGLVGVLGFILAGRKVWWAWYINIANQVLWFAYSCVTHQWGFLVATFVYLFVFIQNAIKWTREHKKESYWSKPVGEITVIDEREDGLHVEGRLY